MFKFLFRRNAADTVEAIKETQRETLIRVQKELNDVVALMDPKPSITVDPNSGFVSLELPEQMPDEALALPAPDAAEKASAAAANDAKSLAASVEAEAKSGAAKAGTDKDAKPEAKTLEDA